MIGILKINPSPTTKLLKSSPVRKMLRSRTNFCIQTNSVDPDQTVKQSDLGPHCLLQRCFELTSRQYSRQYLVMVSRRVNITILTPLLEHYWLKSWQPGLGYPSPSTEMMNTTLLVFNPLPAIHITLCLLSHQLIYSGCQNCKNYELRSDCS